MSNDSPNTNYKWVGKRTRRPDGVDKVSGRARYGDDMTGYDKIVRAVLDAAREMRSNGS